MLIPTPSYFNKLLGGVHKLRLQNLDFFDHLPPSVYILYGMKVYKKSIFSTTYPPPLVNVVCERPLRDQIIFYEVNNNEKINPPIRNIIINMQVAASINSIEMICYHVHIKQKYATGCLILKRKILNGSEGQKDQ